MRKLTIVEQSDIRYALLRLAQSGLECEARQDEFARLHRLVAHLQKHEIYTSPNRPCAGEVIDRYQGKSADMRSDHLVGEAAQCQS